MNVITRDETEHDKEYVLRSEAEAEIERLERRLVWEEARAARLVTHGPGCHTWGPTHYACALREIEQLRDCRTCAKFTSATGGCTSTAQCVDSDQYTATAPRRYWASGPNVLVTGAPRVRLT